MDFEIQSYALVPYVVFSLLYLVILILFRAKRDFLGLLLIIAFCITLGLRDVDAMSKTADPIFYATILSYSSDISALVSGGGVDYAVFKLLHPITASLFDLRTCFLVLHLLFIPFLCLFYASIRKVPGIFFLMVGWMIFNNSGLLLLANFFRQGLSVIFFLTILCGLSLSERWHRLKKVSTLMLPLFHVASVALIPGLISCRMRRFFAISCGALFALGLAIRFAPSSYTTQSGYFGDDGAGDWQAQLWIKVFVIYFMLGIGYLFSLKKDELSTNIANLNRTSIGLLIPTAALLLTVNAPVIGLRYLYYSFAVVFLYIACVISSKKNEFLYALCAIAFCMFGIVTWTYPTVAVLLKW